jgi:hypothetical protein
LILDVEQRWQARFGKDVVRNLRESLERLDGDANAPLTLVSWARTLPQRMARGGPQTRGTPALSNGSAPGRLPGRQLNATHGAKAKLASIALAAAKMNRGAAARWAISTRRP